MGVVRQTVTVSDFRVTTLSNSVFKQNSYVVVHEPSGTALMVDPGMEESFLLHHLEASDIKLDRILLTHGHFDHVGSAETIGRRFGITAEIHQNEERLVRQASTYAFRFARVALRSPRGLHFFSPDTARLQWNSVPVDVLATPGHTSGSVSYSFEAKFVFTGDTLFHSHVGPTNYPESNPVALKQSIAELTRLPDECLVFPGHGRPWTIGEARAWWTSLEGPAPSYFIFGDSAAEPVKEVPATSLAGSGNQS